MSRIDAKKFYNEIMPTKQGENYEHARWHETGIAEAGYQQTKDTIDAFLGLKHSGVHILELGPGAGTWSCVMRAQYPNAVMTLVDISKEMLNRTQKVLGTDNVQYIESAFEDFQAQEVFDLFISSRVIEYMEDKTVFTKKLHSVLKNGAQGIIITKMPHYSRMKLLGKKVSVFHSAQVKPHILVGQLSAEGLHVISIRPVTISVPLCKSAFLNRVVGKLVKTFPVNMLTNPFVESYAVVFEK